VKEEEVQAALSLFVTETVNATAVPETTAALWPGDSVTGGWPAPRVRHDASPGIAVSVVAAEFFAVAVTP
jgi:hypothetical protein